MTFTIATTEATARNIESILSCGPLHCDGGSNRGDAKNNNSIFLKGTTLIDHCWHGFLIATVKLFMPEGPSIVILKELAQPFKGKKVIGVSGNTKEDKERALHKKVIDFKSWGKHFLICFPDFTIRIHFMLFGSYRINEQRDRPPRLSLQFRNGEINFYTNSVKIIEEPLDEIYDWSEDVMSDAWDEKNAIKKLKAQPEMLACDALLDQHLFSGSGNIIKNEVLYRTKIHPLSLVGKIPPKKLKEMVQETRNYSFDFLRWKKAYELKKHYLVYNQKTAKDTAEPVLKAHLGKTNRRTFYTESQKLYR